MKYICVQPAILYYAWQVEVMLNNFMEMDIDLKDVDILCSINHTIPIEWKKLKEKYHANFYFYNDTRETKYYISSIRPNILKQHFTKNPHLKNETIFYHDCDIIFSKKINWEQFEGDDIWYGSDTKWYISYDYIISKGQDIFDEMVRIVDIDPQLVIDNNDNSIGAQYIMKGIDAEFWKDVEKDSEKLFKNITELNRKKKEKDPTHHELQIWCADMWAVLWNGWKRGNKTICHKDLTFSWGTSSEVDYHNHNIMHNAGVTSELAKNQNLFLKSNYMNKLPYNEDLEISSKYASYYYWNEVTKVSKKSALL